MSSEAAEAVEPVLDAASEAILEGIDGVVDVVEVVRNNPIALAFTGVVGLTIGAVGGYFLANKILSKKYEEQIAVEIAEAKEFYASLNKVDVDGAVLTPQDVMDQRHGAGAAAEALREYQGDADEEPELKGEPYDEVIDERHIQKLEREVKAKSDAVNVFVDVTFDLEEEKKYRTSDKPYIITHDEYFAGEENYETISLTYYEMDDTLVDERDQPIEDVESVIGEDHLVRFGSGSKDKNVVFIRNVALETDYEVVKSKGSYLEEVLGMPKEEPNSLKHSNRNSQQSRRRAFRHGED